jgi:hypothetical protein
VVAASLPGVRPLCVRVGQGCPMCVCLCTSSRECPCVCGWNGVGSSGCLRASPHSLPPPLSLSYLSVPWKEGGGAMISNTHLLLLYVRCVALDTRVDGNAHCMLTAGAWRGRGVLPVLLGCQHPDRGPPGKPSTACCCCGGSCIGYVPFTLCVFECAPPAPCRVVLVVMVCGEGSGGGGFELGSAPSNLFPLLPNLSPSPLISSLFPSSAHTPCHHRLCSVCQILVGGWCCCGRHQPRRPAAPAPCCGMWLRGGS